MRGYFLIQHRLIGLLVDDLKLAFERRMRAYLDREQPANSPETVTQPREPEPPAPEPVRPVRPAPEPVPSPRPPAWKVARHPEADRAPFPMCFTPAALQRLLATVGDRPPESGAKGFGPKDGLGLDILEFDESGSAAAGGAVYAPDVRWGQARVEHHLSRPEPAMRLWTGDLHSHPAGCGWPSSAAGRGLGDLGYVREVFEQNEWMEWFLIPIVTNAGSDEVEIHPWMCRRGEARPRIADLMVCDAGRFPARPFNLEWQVRTGQIPATDPS